jgi:hypothetical protein
MGREIKRVPIDFSWPLQKPWEGYENPHGQPCPASGKTCFNGETAALAWLCAVVRALFIACDNAAAYEREGVPKDRCWPHPYLVNMPTAPYNDGSLLPPTGADLVALGVGLAGREGGVLGHDGCDRAAGVWKIIEAAGLPREWGACPVCKGTGIDPACLDAYEAWERAEPPTGDGWQLWETVSDSPVSPVFRTADEFVAWLCEPGTYQGCSRASAEAFVRSGWVPSGACGDDGVLLSGIAASVLMGDGEA